jgi:hypothetical protein
MPERIKWWWLLPWLAVSCTAAAGEIYRTVDEDGVVTFSNVDEEGEPVELSDSLSIMPGVDPAVIERALRPRAEPPPPVQRDKEKKSLSQRQAERRLACEEVKTTRALHRKRMRQGYPASEANAMHRRTRSLARRVAELCNR